MRLVKRSREEIFLCSNTVHSLFVALAVVLSLLIIPGTTTPCLFVLGKESSRLFSVFGWLNKQGSPERGSDVSGAGVIG